VPNRSDRDRDQLVRNVRERISVDAPGWTDEAGHDPGVTIVELLGFVAESVVERGASSRARAALRDLITRLDRLDRGPCQASSLARVRYFDGRLRGSPGPFLLSPFILAELDCLLSTRVSAMAAAALLGQVAAGAYRLEAMDAVDVAQAADVIDRYADLELGLADASLVVLAGRHGVRDILTLDERHFRSVLDPRGRPFRLLPSDV
jgi:hypothetical protein